MNCPIHHTPLICPRCAGAKGGKAGSHSRKGFAVSGAMAQAKARATRASNKEMKQARRRSLARAGRKG